MDVTNRDSEDVLRYAYMNSYYQTGLRNLLDRSILSHTDLDVERGCSKVDEIPFDFSRKRMSVVVDYEGDHVLICKGAVEEILQGLRPVPGRRRDPSADRPDQEGSDGGIRGAEPDGYRVLAIAYREFPADKEVFAVADESDLILLGYIAFFDPPKESGATGARGPAQDRRRDQDPDGRQRPGHRRRSARTSAWRSTEVVTGDQLRTLTDEANCPSWRRRRLCLPGFRPRKRRASSARCRSAGTSSATWATASTTRRR